MNSASTLSHIRRSVTAALALGIVLLSVGCATTTSASKKDTDKATYAENYGAVHRTMEKLLAESNVKTGAQPTVATVSIASGLGSASTLASNP